MSRCFPFPPSGYAGNLANNEALILSIKLQRESEREEIIRSEKRKERKDKKKEKKRDKKQKKYEPFYDEKKIFHQGQPCNVGKQGSSPTLQSAKEKLFYDSDSMEKSSLTEEHRQPCVSSDSTENSGKRKLHAAPSQCNGHVIRIRLSSKKNESTITCGAREQKSCSTSGRTESLVRKDRSVLCRSSSLRSSSLLQVTETTQPPHSPFRVEAAVPSTSRVEMKAISTLKDKVDVPSTSRLRLEVPSSSAETKVNAFKDVAPMTVFASKDTALTASDRKMMEEELLHRNLIHEWVPTPVDKTLHDLNDDDWLFETKRADDRSAKRLKSCSDEVPRYGGVAVVQPLAHYLADIGIHALPFTVPF